MKKTLLFVTLLIVVIFLSVVQVSRIAYAGTKNKQVDFLDADKFSIIVCGVSNQKWTFISENYNSISSATLVAPRVHVMLGFKTGGQRIKYFNIQGKGTKITLTSDTGEVLESGELTLWSGFNLLKTSSTGQAKLYGAFSDDVKSITVEGRITAKCINAGKEQTITVPIKKATIKLSKGPRDIKEPKLKKKL